MSAVVEWRLQNSSFSWISAFQCSRQTLEINATRIFHPKDYLKSNFKKFKSHMSSVSNPVNITLQCIWYTQEQSKYFIKTYAAKVL